LSTARGRWLVPAGHGPAVLAGCLVLALLALLRGLDPAPCVALRERAFDLIQALQGGRSPQRPWWAGGAETGYGLLAGLLCVLATVKLRGRSNPLPPLLLLPLCAAVSVLAYLGPRWLLDPTFPMLAVLLPLPPVIALNQASNERIRRRLEAALAQERAEKDRLEGELQAARKIQMGILPRQFPAFPGRKDFDLHAMIEPARAVGGDLYDFFLLDQDRLFFMIGDVSGKGVPAALFMALTKALYKSSALRRRGAIAQIMSEAGRELGRENPEMMFVSVFAGILDLRTGELEYANAGHEPPLWLRPGQPPVRLSAGGGPPLCAVDDFEYAAERMQLCVGDCLMLFTDGVSEAQSRAGELFSGARITAALHGAAAGEGPQQLVVRLYSAVQSFAKGAEPADDITILAVRRNAPEAG
jgi:serine phosphatase RsbU (regulator of sigma subunit)